MSALPAPVAPSLFDLEQDLQAFFNTEDLVPEEQRAEFESALAEQLKASVAKRDRVAQFIQHCSHQQENCDKEIARLKARKESFERAEKRVKQYVQSVIESLGPDAKGKPKKLEGNLATFSLRQTPGHIEITDESKVPAEVQNVEVCMSLPQWKVLLAVHRVDFRDAHVTVDKREAKRRIEAGEDVPGVDLTMGGHCLVIK